MGIIYKFDCFQLIIISFKVSSKITSNFDFFTEPPSFSKNDDVFWREKMKSYVVLKIYFLIYDSSCKIEKFTGGFW